MSPGKAPGDIFNHVYGCAYCRFPCLKTQKAGASGSVLGVQDESPV